ncbi:MAG: response regulator transcription factor [Muribaculaceae bacterium]|nr:response regulator transcription factor [Muribaculaceae bacterium]
MARQVLIVDDEETLREALGTYLELEGYSVKTASNAEEALRQDISEFDILLLDIMMDGISGIELASKLKADENTAHIPIIFLTAKDSDDDMVAGLNLGADDYICKPYSVKNVIARIEAVLRRTADTVSPVTAKREITCDRDSLSCHINGKPLKLPRKEFEILSLLLENPGRVFTREELVRKIWPENVIVVDRAVDVHIARLRGKIAPYGKNIISRSGYGYGWQD